jgi:acyl carrier protein
VIQRPGEHAHPPRHDDDEDACVRTAVRRGFSPAADDTFGDRSTAVAPAVAGQIGRHRAVVRSRRDGSFAGSSWRVGCHVRRYVSPIATAGGKTMEEQIRRFLTASFFVDDIAADASFLETGIIDSTGVLELVTFVEDEFAIDIVDDDLRPENLDSIERLVAFIARKQRTGAVA